MSEILAFAFMRNAFVACSIVAVLCGVIGYLLVLRGEVFAGHALAHIAFPGATGAALIGLSPLAGAGLFTLAAGIAMALLGARAQRDMVIGVVLSFALGLGLLFLHFYTAYAGMATALLFGNVLAVDRSTIVLLAVLAFVCAGVLAVVARPLLFASLQPESAEAKGMPLGLLSAIFMALTALAITEAIQIVGVLLVFSLLVVPAAAASQFARTVAGGAALSVAIGLLTVWASLVLAYKTDAPVSFWITTIGTAVYLASAMWRRGIVRSAASMKTPKTT